MRHISIFRQMENAMKPPPPIRLKRCVDCGGQLTDNDRDVLWRNFCEDCGRDRLAMHRTIKSGRLPAEAHRTWRKTPCYKRAAYIRPILAVLA